MQTVRSALALALLKPGNNNAAMMAMMAITTNNSISVNPVSVFRFMSNWTSPVIALDAAV